MIGINVARTYDFIKTLIFVNYLSEAALTTAASGHEKSTRGIFFLIKGIITVTFMAFIADVL